MKHGLVLGLLSGALLVGCMSAGVEVRPEQMATFRRGVTTIQEVTTTLGPASVQTALDDGSMLLVYTYVTSRPHPENYIPIIGSLVGGSDTHTSAAVFLFDARGVLKSANTTTSNVGTGLSTELQRRAPVPIVEAPGLGDSHPPAAVRGVEPPVVVKGISPAAAEGVEPPSKEEDQPAPENSVEPLQEQGILPPLSR
ncbi:hypothetical protein EVC45_06195 [Paraburkholderia sp. UYCP14C]|uniref:hypothetical protein n=1 Tax=Paraburkholderia sp. UYCP14C TaxID=2511130 RepID=UPI0010208FC9|nr:hypothetical protein [Paraburkholderia sp. UYCP14C]RZF30562.1 hypothetical protein EVC45_06195 [Paraburkholderia sp. UYCP14C]